MFSNNRMTDVHRQNIQNFKTKNGRFTVLKEMYTNVQKAKTSFEAGTQALQT